MSDVLARALELLDLPPCDECGGDHSGTMRNEIRDMLADLVPELVAHVEKLHSWDGLMSLLDEHWPEDIFPTMDDTDKRDPGPRIVSLIRTVDLYRKSLDMAHHETADEILRANEAERQRDRFSAMLPDLRMWANRGQSIYHRDGDCTCDGNPSTTNGPEEDCPWHGREYSYWVERSSAQRDGESSRSCIGCLVDSLPHTCGFVPPAQIPERWRR